MKMRMKKRMRMRMRRRMRKEPLEGIPDFFKTTAKFI